MHAGKSKFLDKKKTHVRVNNNESNSTNDIRAAFIL